MADRWVIVLAVAAAAGALEPRALPVAPIVVAVGLAWRWRRPLLLCLGVGLLASALSERAWAGLDGVESQIVEAEVLLLTDPEPTAGGVRADVALAGRRLELVASGDAAALLRDRLAGERCVLRGEVAPAPPDATWLVPRHVAGRLTVHRVDALLPARQPYAVANALRGLLTDGARPLTPRHRALLTGLVIGDDRAQPADLTDDFRGAGLTHLLAVSGQNVAFVLVLAGPLVRRLRLWPRLAGTLALIGLFGVVTRFEPSVLRASAMAAVAVVTLTVGQPATRLRILALAVTALLLVDPLLIHAVGFRLSVLAAAAIVVLAPAVTAALPGPYWLTEPLGVTIAAQLGVAPILLTTFGPIPLASLPANLLAVPAAGLVMVWGLTGGLAAGVLGGGAAEALHLPTRLLLGWIEGVASRAAAAPLGELHLGHVLAVGAGLALAVVARLFGLRRTVQRGALGLAALAVASAVVTAQVPPPLRSVPSSGIVRWHAGGTDVVALGGGGWRSSLGVDSTLEELRRAGVDTIALLVIVDDAVTPAVVDAVADRHRIGAVLVPSGADPRPHPDAVAVPAAGTEVEVGDLHVTIAPGEERLVVEARPRSL